MRFITSKGEVRKRGLVIDDLIGITDEAILVHVPTGRTINPPRDIADDRAFVQHFLDADHDGWEESRQAPWGQPLQEPLKSRLKATLLSYSGR